MEDLLAKIGQVESSDMEAVLDAVLARYNQLFPQWDVNIVSLRKNESRNNQINGIIQTLEHMKEMNPLCSKSKQQPYKNLKTTQKGCRGSDTLSYF